MGDVSLDHQSLTHAFSGLGVNEKALISIAGKWQPDHKNSYRKATPSFFSKDEHHFEKWNEQQVESIKHEALRFKCAVVLWTMHPWERDARLLNEALTKGPKGSSLIIEVACTRTSEDLLGARKAYHSIFHSSVEEDVASHVHGHERKLLVALVSAYRYEGARVRDETAKSEAEALNDAIKKNFYPIEDDEVIRILSTRSKLHLKAIARHYKELFGKDLVEEFQGNVSLKEAIQCLVVPEVYFCEVLDAAMSKGADEFIKEALTQVIVSQADINMKEIKAAYHSRFGVHLSLKIEETCLGNFKDFLLTLVAKGD